MSLLELLFAAVQVKDKLTHIGYAEPSLLMRVKVTVMYVGVMRMAVRLRRMRVNMAVRFSTIPFGGVVMMVMRVMPMAVSMGQWFVYVRVLMSFAHVQPNSQRHQ